MLIDIRPDEFEKMARAGFFENVHLRAQDIETARARCKSLGLQTVAPTVYRTGTTTESAAELTKRKEMKRTVKENAGQSERKVRNNGRRVEAGG